MKDCELNMKYFKFSCGRIIRFAVMLVMLSVIFLFVSGCEKKDYSSFAQCLNEKGVVFYGSEFCGHCNDFKQRMGAAMQYMNYVECSTPQSGQTQDCADKKIEYYPTFIFADGTQLHGAVEFNVLGMKVGCPVE
jgi:hypothetical protein